MVCTNMQLSLSATNSDIQVRQVYYSTILYNLIFYVWHFSPKGWITSKHNKSKLSQVKSNQVKSSQVKSRQVESS